MHYNTDKTPPQRPNKVKLQPFVRTQPSIARDHDRTSIGAKQLPHAPRRDENEVERRGARANGGKAESPQPAHVSSVDQGEAGVDQDGPEGGQGQRENLLVEDVGLGDALDGGVDLLLRAGSFSDACCCWQ